MNTLQNTLAAIAALTLMTGCGNTTSDRALSGAAIGAGTGAVGSAVLGGSPMTGALVGGAVGAAAGGLTDRDDIDFGKPIWR